MRVKDVVIGLMMATVILVLLAAATASAGVCGPGTYSKGAGPSVPGDVSTCPTVPTTVPPEIGTPVSIVRPPEPVVEPVAPVETDPVLVQPVAKPKAAPPVFMLPATR
jgi:hypothetical protein